MGVLGDTMKKLKLSDILLRLGHEYQIGGVIFTGRDGKFFAMLPEEDEVDAAKLDHLDLDPAGWQRLMQQLDHLEVEVTAREADGTLSKAILRKSQRQIEQGISWEVYRRDGYACRYCGKDGVPLTVDHLVCYEVGGPSTVENLIAACRRCNKTRGQLPYADWLRHPYYQKVSGALSPAQQQANEALAATLDKIQKLNYIKSRR